MMSAKLITLGLLKTQIFWDKVYDVIFSVYDVANTILSREFDDNVDVIMWSRFDNYSIPITEVTIVL